MTFEQKWAYFSAALLIITLIVMIVTNRRWYCKSSKETPKLSKLLGVFVVLLPGWIALIATAPPMYERTLKYAAAIVLLIGYPGAYLWQRQRLAHARTAPAEGLSPEERRWWGMHQNMPIKPWTVLVIVSLGLFMLISTYLKHK